MNNAKSWKVSELIIAGMVMIGLAGIVLGKFYFDSRSAPVNTWDQRLALLHGRYAMNGILINSTVVGVKDYREMPRDALLTDAQIHEAEGIVARNAKPDAQPGEWAARSEDWKGGELETVIIFKDDLATYWGLIQRDADGNWHINQHGVAGELHESF